jgi:hypothetical protein
MPAIYRKTASGQAEVSSKAHALPPRARSLLIMVDGQRDAQVLRGMLGPAVDEGLELLLREGLIEKSGSAAASPAPPASVAAPAPAAPSAPAALPAMSFEETRRAAARAVTEAMGPMADSVAMRIERAKTPAELQAALQLAANAIADISSRSRAEAFRQRFLPE